MLQLWILITSYNTRSNLNTIWCKIYPRWLVIFTKMPLFFFSFAAYFPFWVIKVASFLFIEVFYLIPSYLVFLTTYANPKGKMRTCTRKAMSTTSVVMTPQTSPRTPLATVEEPMSTSIYKSDDHCQTIMTSVSQIMLSLTRVNIDVTWNMCWNGRWGNALKLARWE